MKKWEYQEFHPILHLEKNMRKYLICRLDWFRRLLVGSPMARWNPENGDLYQNMIDKIHETGDRCAGILWYQGCSDTDPEPAKKYFEHFYSFVMAVRKELGYQVPFLPCS